MQLSLSLTTLRRATSGLLATLMVATTMTAVSATPAAAAPEASGTGIVAASPRAGTPAFSGVSDGDDMIHAIEELNGYVAAGGLFDTAKKPGATAQPVRNFSIWTDDTGVILPAPAFDDEVYAIEAAADGRSWYVGGRFKTVDGVARRALVKVDRDGTVDPTFAPDVQWVVKDMTLVGETLYVGGNIQKVNGQAHTGLAALDATTGAPSLWSPTFAGPYSTPSTVGSVSVDKLDATPDGTRLVVAGNFATIDGVATGRVAQFDITTPTPQLIDWSVAGFRIPKCPIWKTAAFVTDIDVAPAGDWFVVSTTGGWGNPNGSDYLCDAAMRFELNARGNNVRPTWISHTGGDSATSVKVAGEVVYVGGHQRWMNNPYLRNKAGAGSVVRTGISAHDARNGIPLPWNPIRNPRGFGAYELTMSPNGLWVGQDTGNIGGKYRGFAAHMPNLGGQATLGWTGTGTLPVDVLQPRVGDDDLLRFTGTSSSSLGRTPTTFTDSLVGITSIGDDLLIAADGKLQRVASRGTGAVTDIDLRGLAPAYLDPTLIRGLAYDEQRGELLYTLHNSDALLARSYEPTAGLVGALARVVATSANIDWRTTRSMFLVDGVLYVGRTDQKLYAIPYGVDGPADVVGTAVSGPGKDAAVWDKPSTSLTTAGTMRGNRAPVAEFAMSCSGRSCRVDAGDSVDPFGEITRYRFTAIGTAGTATLDAAHGVLTFPADGEVSVTLQVTDAQGAIGTRVRTGTVLAPPLTLGGQNTSNTTATTHTVTVPSGTTDGSVLLLHMAVNRAGALPALPTGLDGWSLLGTQTTSATQSAVWWTTANASAVSTPVSVALTTSSKASLTLSSWSGANLTDPIAAFASGSGSGATAAHASPATSTAAEGTVIEMWSMKSGTVTDWAPPGDTATVVESHGTAGGHISTLITSRAKVPGGPVGGSVATADVADVGVTAWTVALRAA